MDMIIMIITNEPSKGAVIKPALAMTTRLRPSPSDETTTITREPHLSSRFPATGRSRLLATVPKR